MKAKANSSVMDIKQLNKMKIFRYIGQHEQQSKQDIAKNLGISMPTVLQNIKELEEEGLVEATGMFHSTGGRKAKAMSVVGKAKYAIGIDLTQNHISMVLVDLNRQDSMRRRISKLYEDTMDYYQELGRLLETFIDENGIDRSRLLGVGIAVPGIIDADREAMTRSHMLGSKEVSFRSFKQFIPYPTVFCNDANAAGFAEMKDLGGSAIYLSLSYTLGGAIYLDNNLYIGGQYKSGEFGHMLLIPGGNPCYCGKKGCFNAYCGSKVLSDYTQGDLELFFQKLDAGDPGCIEKWDVYLEQLAIAVTNLRMAFDCDIILGGYIGGHMEKHLLDLKRKAVQYNTFEQDTEYIKVCKYRREAAALGVGLQYIEQFYNAFN